MDLRGARYIAAVHAASAPGCDDHLIEPEHSLAAACDVVLGARRIEAQSRMIAEREIERLVKRTRVVDALASRLDGPRRLQDSLRLVAYATADARERERVQHPARKTPHHAQAQGAVTDAAHQASPQMGRRSVEICVRTWAL